MAIVLTIVFVIVYTYGLFRWDKHVSWRLNSKVSKTIKYVHYLTLFVALTIAFTYLQFGIGLRGLWTTRTFVIISLLTGVFFNFVTDKTILNKLEKVYFKLFSLLPSVTGIVLCVPFLGVLIVLSLLGRLIEPSNKIYFEDEHLRINSSFMGLLAPPRVDIFTKNAIFEKHIYRPDFYANDFDSIAVRYDNDSTRIYVYGLPKEDYKPKVICIESQK
jgi:hypothetical protein